MILKPLKSCDDNKSLTLFHLSTYSHSKNFDDFQLLIQSPNIDFDVIAILESRIITNKPLVVLISLPNNSYDFCSTESSAGGTLLYINSD